jgi:hypothetical protein
MQRQVIVGLLSLVAFSAPARSEDFEVGETTELLKGLPTDAAEVVRRAEGCVHWQGEEPFDQERRKQIEDALRELKCAKLRDDNTLLQAKYQSNEAVTKVLDYLEKYYVR